MKFFVPSNSEGQTFFEVKKHSKDVYIIFSSSGRIYASLALNVVQKTI